VYRQPGSVPLALSGITDGCRMGAARRRTSGRRTLPASKAICCPQPQREIVCRRQKTWTGGTGQCGV
jgi:hypothetical protein